MSSGASLEFAGTPRYEIMKRLGAGGMGVVYHAKDRDRNDEIALKTLIRIDGSSILHLKQEFRALADIVHPNLVTLHDLEMHEGQWFFTMELVRGRTLFEYLKAERHLSVVQATLRQLAKGIFALHQLGKLHRDIKPSNVMVDDTGRVVILDFGLVTDLSASRTSKTRSPAVGTPWYMAPEQARASVSPTGAADWYAFGVLLYEALTGRLPFEGNMAAVIYKKQIAEPPAPRSISPDIPEYLDDLCVELLSRDAELRPSGEEVLRRLDERPAGPAAKKATKPREKQAIVGREKELAALRSAVNEAKNGRLMVARVSGPSGIGKSSLVRTVLDEVVADKRAIVLQGRCYQRESVPFKAVDSLIDKLSDVWRALPEAQAAELVPPDIDLLARVFPVLLRVPAVERAAPTPHIADVQEQRRRTFGALKEIVRRIATRRMLVIAIDDLQWGDADSSALLASLLTIERPLHLLIIFSYRSEDVSTNPALRSAIAESSALATAIDVPLDPLPARDAAQLARGLLLESLQRADSMTDDQVDELVDEIVRESHGGPWLVQELVRDASTSSDPIARAPSPSVETVLVRRMSRLSDEAKRLLEVVALAGRPVPETVAVQVASVASGARDALAMLRADQLLVTRGSPGTDLLETYHDRVRESVVARLDEPARRAMHLSLGLALETREDSDPQTLLDHFLGAGDRERSRKYALEGAARADHALAFDQAVRLYRAALELEDDPRGKIELTGKLAESLANAGRGSEAAQHFQSAGCELEKIAPGDDVITQLLLRAVEEYLRSGFIEEGSSVLAPIARAQGITMPKSSGSTLLSLGIARAKLRFRGLKFDKHDATKIPREALLELELCRSTYVGFSLVDPLLSLYFQAQYLLLALEYGEPKSLAISFTGEAIYHATTGGKRGKTRCSELLAIAESLAKESGDDYAIATHKFQSGSAAYLSAEFRRAFQLHAEAVDILRARCTGVFWELSSGDALMLTSLAYLGEIAELKRRHTEALRRADERGDRYAGTGLRIGPLCVVWLAQDRPDMSQNEATAALEMWPARVSHLQDYLQLVALVEADLYLGTGAAAIERVNAAWSKLERAQLLRIQSVAIELRNLRARAALAAAAELPSEDRARERLLSLAESEIKLIARDDLLFSAPFAAALRAGVAHVRGDASRVVRELAMAREGFERAEMKVHARCAERALLVASGDSEALVRLDTAMQQIPIAKPERIQAVHVPALATR